MTGPIKTWVDGIESDCVSASDRGLQYGDGVFETLAVVAGQPLLWSRHLKRLLAGCRALQFDAMPGATLESDVAQACRGVARGVLKCVVTRGTGGRGYGARPDRVTTVLTLWLWPWPEYATNVSEGIALHLCRTRLAHNPALAGIKHLNRLEQVLARREWNDEFAEGLMLDQAGGVIEGTMSNVFAVVDGELLTPDVSQAGVRGIMRDCVLECAHALGIPARETRLPLDVVMRAEELFVTNSIIGVWPVKRFNDRDYAIGKVAQILDRELRGRGYAASRA